MAVMVMLGGIGGPCAAKSVAAPLSASDVSLASDRAAPQSAGTVVTWTAQGVGGIAPYSYKWWVWDGAAWQLLRDWTTSPTFTWTPSVASSAYRVAVWVRSAGNGADELEASRASVYAITAPPPSPRATDVSLTSDRGAPQVAGASIAWTAQGVGGTAPYSYKWWVWDGAAWQLLRDWAATPTLTWVPASANSAYRVAVWVRSAGNTVDALESSRAAAFPISAASAARATDVSLTADRSAPQATGAAVHWAAQGVGGIAPYSYKWWVWDGASWQLLRDWSPEAALAWTPTVANREYRVAVWVRSAGNLADALEASRAAMFAIDPAPGATSKVTAVTLAPDRSAPQTVGTSVRWTATATGGVAPLSYKWWLWDGLAWHVLSEWSNAATLTWTPSAVNPDFRVAVWARSASATADTFEANGGAAFPIGGAGGDCEPTLDPNLVTIGSGGGSSSVRVRTTSPCAWQAVSQASWITATPTTATSGDGTVHVAVAPNTDPVARTGVVRVGARVVTVTQAGAATPDGCTYAVFPTALDVGSGNGTASVVVTAPAGCPWTTESSSFVQLAPSSGTGSRTLTISVENNTGLEPRVALVSVVGRSITVTQAGRGGHPDGCTVTLAPTTVSVDAEAAQMTLDVVTASGCSWTAQSGASFVHVSGGGSGTGPGRIAIAVDANGSDAARSAVLHVGDAATTITQAPSVSTPACTYQLSTQTSAVSYAGGVVTVSVTARAGCEWEVVSQTPWVHVVEVSEASGNGSVWLSIDHNAGDDRAATVVIGGQPLTISQGAPPSSANPEDVVWVTPPDAHRVGECFGNCGGGCSDFVNPCGGPHYWERTVLSAPQYVGDVWEPVCSGGSSWFVVRPSYRATVRWTYHGTWSPVCQAHDNTCRAFGLSLLDGATCVLTAGLAALTGPGLCAGASPRDWSYEFTDVGVGAPVAFIDGAPSCE